MSQRIVLAADVGGTKTEMALAAVEDGRLRVHVQRAYESQSFKGLDDIVEPFLADPQVAPQAPAIAAACFSVAGPVEKQAATLTNLGWEVSSAALMQRYGLKNVRLINDFIATGYGVARLGAEHFENLQPGTPVERATQVVIGAGTGLGCGMMTWTGERYTVQPSEAGHADFAPVDESQDRLLAYLRRNYGRVSYERVISGPGLMRIFGFLQDSGMGVASKQLQEATKRKGDPAEVIADFAIAKLDPLAVRALDLFVAVYGSFAGNMALGALARGGVYVAGGIAPKIIGKLRDGTFIRAFNNKGRFSAMLSAMPVRVVLNPQVGLYGALDVANRIA